jgi:hypothetical protein
LKLDLRKAYDCVDWDFLRLILISTGCRTQLTNWIIACVTSPTTAALINGEATDFFKNGRSLRQGFPLLPLLFILVMEGLSLLLKSTQEEGKISGIKVSSHFKILHVLFVDDIITLSRADLKEWWDIDKIIGFFCKVYGLMVNQSKSIVFHAGLSSNDISPQKNILHYTFMELSSGFKYLRYRLKIGSYKVEDWKWLLTKFMKRIEVWCNRWISLGGRYTLVKSILEGQPVYWMSLEAIPRTILNQIQKLMFKFLWNGSIDSQKFHLCRWDLLSRPKKSGGWGFRNLVVFNTTLITNSLWRVLTLQGIWHKLSRDKYLRKFIVIEWIRLTNHKTYATSRIWNNMVQYVHVILH